MLSNIKRLNFFPYHFFFRQGSTLISQECGLIKLHHISLDDLNHRFKGKDTVVLMDEVLYFFEQKNKKILPIKKSVANEFNYLQLKLKCSDTWRMATSDEVQLIKRALSPAGTDEKHNQSCSHNVSHSYMTSSDDEVNYAYALSDAERRQKELYRNYLIFDTLTDGSRFEQNSGHSSRSSSHSSHSSDRHDSSEHSSSYDSQSCGGSSFND